MGLGIADIDEQTVPEQLGNMSFIALDDCNADFLVCTHDVPIVFGVELGREFGGIDQVAEQHGELAAFGLWRRSGVGRTGSG